MPESLIKGDSSLIEAVKAGRLSDVQDLLLINGCEKFTLQDDVGRTPLHWAAENGYLRLACIFIDNGWEINTRDNQGQTPLHVACQYRHVDIALCLLAGGCDVNTCDNQHNTPLHRAVRSNLEEVVAMLCSCGAEVCSINCCQWTPLYEALRTGNEVVINALLKYGAGVNDIQRNDMSPFLTAIFYYRLASKKSYNIEGILKALIRHGCFLSHTDGIWSHLSAAVSIDQTSVARTLILHGCRIELAGRYTRSLLVDLFDRCDPDIVKLFIMAGYHLNHTELELCARRVPSFSRAFMRLLQPDEDITRRRRSVLKWLEWRIRTPFRLSDFCRVSIRKALNKASGDISILPRIERLPLPTVLRGFVALADMAGSPHYY